MPFIKDHFIVYIQVELQVISLDWFRGTLESLLSLVRIGRSGNPFGSYSSHCFLSSGLVSTSYAQFTMRDCSIAFLSRLVSTVCMKCGKRASEAHEQMSDGRIRQ
jgi:hypothetical protein